MSGPGLKTGQKKAPAPVPAPRPVPGHAATKPVGTPVPRSTAHLDTAHFKAGKAPQSEQDDLAARVEAARKAQAAQSQGAHPGIDGHGEQAHGDQGHAGDHGKIGGHGDQGGHGEHAENGEHGEHGEGHHGHHPGQILGEASRSANHLSHGAQGLKSAAQEGQALKAAAQEAEALKAAAQEARALKAAAQEAEAVAVASREAQVLRNAVNVVKDAARVAGAAEAGIEAAHDAAEGAQIAKGADAAADAASGASSLASKAPGASMPQPPAGPVPKAPHGASHASGHGHAPSKLGKGLGAIGVAGGGIQVAVGIGQIRNGQTGEGIKNVVVGGGFAGSGIAELTLASKVATKVAAPLAGGASVIEGGYDVYQGIKKGDGKKVALGGAKGVGGALLAASPFVTGSVVGAPVGVVMAIAGTTLIAGAAVVENWDTLKGWAKAGASAVGRTAARAWEGATNLASSAWDGAKSVFSGW